MVEGTLPAVRAETELDRFARLGQWLAASESGDGGPNALGASAALRLFYADALGLSPLAAAELSVIKGRLFVQAKLLRAMAAQHGYRVRRTPDSDDKTCTAVLEDASGKELGRTTFTFEDATKAGLVRDRSAWQTHPARMLWARASKFVLDDYAPEITLGLGTVDEAAEIEDRPAEPEPADRDDEAIDAEFSDVQEPASGSAGPAKRKPRPEAKTVAASAPAAGKADVGAPSSPSGAPASAGIDTKSTPASATVERDNEDTRLVSEAQRRELFELVTGIGVSSGRYREIIEYVTGQTEPAGIPADKFDAVVLQVKAENVPFG